MYNLFQLVHAMYEYRSLLITTNKDFTAFLAEIGSVRVAIDTMSNNNGFFREKDRPWTCRKWISFWRKWIIVHKKRMSYSFIYRFL